MTAPRARGHWAEQPAERVERRIVVERDGTVVARSGKVEYGQGIRTGFAMIVSEELDVPVDRVLVELGETDRVPWDMGTFGSMSTAVDGARLRAAAAHARTILLDRASALLGLPTTSLATRDGHVVAGDGRSLSYPALTAAGPLIGPVPETALGGRPVRPVAMSLPRSEATDVVTGRACYPGDVRLPGMLHGHALSPPRFGCGLVKVVDHGAGTSPGVVATVRDGDFIGIVAEHEEQIHEALARLEVEWGPPPGPSGPIEAVLRRDENVAAVVGAGFQVIKADYHVPHIAHASIGPSAAVASVGEAGADLYVATQRPLGLREDVAELLGLDPERVKVHPTIMGGMYGRGNMNDAAIEAVRLSRAVRRPVLVQWTRSEEFRRSPARPMLEAALEASIDSGSIAGWRSRVRTNHHTYFGGMVPQRVLELTSGRNAVPSYRLGSAEVVLEVVPGAVRTGALRSLAAAPNVFAIESFMDELAYAVGEDPIAFRLRHLEDLRLRRVLEAVRDGSGWDRRNRKGGTGFGVGCAIYHDTAVAQVAEVTVSASGTVRLARVWCVVDAGRLVYPDGARNQIEGGIQQAASWTLLEELGRRDGEVTTETWRDYPIGTFHDAPREIDVVFVAPPDAPSSGIGEPGSVPTAAAIANAVFEACGARVRRLPLTPAAVCRAPRLQRLPDSEH